MRVLIVDDEAPARARLRQLLSEDPDVEVAGEAESGIQAMELAVRARLDLLLLDVDLPDFSGIDVAACLPEPRPLIVFCAAYGQPSAEVFQRHAIDYLLKPIHRAPLAQTLDRVRYFSPARTGDRSTRPSGGTTPPMHFLVKDGPTYVVLPESRVLFFESEGRRTRVSSETGQFWMDPTLDELEERLDPARFLRVSDAVLVSVNAVAEVRRRFGGWGEVVLKNGRRLEVKRRRCQALLKALEGRIG